MLRRRRQAAVIAASLAAHALLLAAYVTTRRYESYAEPPVLQVELLRPQRRPPPKTARTVRPAPPAAAPAPSILSQPAPPSAPAIPATPRPPEPRPLTDQELLERAGPRPDIAKLHEELARRPLYSRRLGPGPDDCKPASEHSNRIAPPCPAFAGGAPPPPAPLPNRPDLAGEVASKDAFKAYGERYGPHGMADPNDFPGMRCKTQHTHCGPPPADPPGYRSPYPKP